MHTLLKLAYYILIMSIPDNKNQTIAWGFPDLFDNFDELNGEMEFVDGKTFREQRDKTVTNITWDKDKKQFVSYNYKNKELDRVSIPEIEDYIKNRVKWVSKVEVNEDGTSFDFFNVDDKLLFNVPIKELENFKENAEKYYADSEIEDGVISFKNTDGKVTKTITLPKDPHTGEYFTGVKFNSGTGSLDFLNSQRDTVASVNIPQIDTKKYLTSARLTDNKAEFLNEENLVVSSFEIPKPTKVNTDKYFVSVSQLDKVVSFKNEKGDTLGTISLPDSGSGGGGTGGIEQPAPPNGTVILNDVLDMDGHHDFIYKDASLGKFESVSIKLKVLNLSNTTKTSDTYDIQYGFSIDKVLAKFKHGDWREYDQPKDGIYEIPKGKYRINFACDPNSSLKQFDLSDDKMFTFYSSQVFVGTNNNLNFKITPYYGVMEMGTTLNYPLQSTSSGNLTLVLIDTVNINIEQINSVWINGTLKENINWVIRYKAKVDGKTILRKPNSIGSSFEYSKDGTVTVKGSGANLSLDFQYNGYKTINVPINYKQ